MCIALFARGFGSLDMGLFGLYTSSRYRLVCNMHSYTSSLSRCYDRDLSRDQRDVNRVHSALLKLYSTIDTMSDTDFVLLESEDGYTFVVPRKVACASGTLRSMLDEEGE